MAIAFLDAQTGDSGSASSLNVTINKPTGVVSGSLMIVLLEGDSLSPGDGNWSMASSGFTKVVQNSLTADGADWMWGYKVAGGSEASTYTFSDAGGSAGQGSVVGIIAAYSGVDTVSPINAHNETNDDTATASPFTISAPTITPTVDNSMIVWLGVADKTGQVNATFAVPSGYTSRATKNGWSTNPWNSIALADLLQTTAAATGAQTASWTAAATSAAKAGIHIALKPLVASVPSIPINRVARPRPFIPGIVTLGSTPA